MYPINLNMKGCQTAVFGGGTVAFRKLKRLLAEEACVTLVSPELCPELEKLVQELPKERLVWQQMRHIDFCWPNEKVFRLVFAATDSQAANHEIVLKARQYGIFVNNATAPDECDFQVPSRVCQGNLDLTVSTGGESPALSRLLRQDLEARYHDGFGEFLAWLGEMRRRLRQQESRTAIRQKLWRQAMTPEVFNYILNHRLEQAKNEVRRKIDCAGAEPSDSSCRDS